MARILVVDDERDLVWAVQYSLSDQGHDVAVAYDGVEALAEARRQRPDLIILDILMPRLDGIEVCRAVRRDARLGAVPILFLTARNAIEDRVRGLTEGGDDYISKPFDLRELEARVQALLRRSRAVSEMEYSAGGRLAVRDLVLEVPSGRVTVAGRLVRLTPAEFDLLRYLMARPGEIIGTRHLLEQVWGYAEGTGDVSLVRWHVKNLRAKIEVDPDHPSYIQTIPRRGYLLDDGTSLTSA